MSTKTFDSVPYERLLMKVQHYGIRGRVWTLIREFLSERTEQVLLQGFKSQPVEVLLRVPQGSVLGPLLFLLCVSDLPEYVTSTARLFADDCLLYKEVSCSQDQLRLQQDLDNLTKWQNRWQLRFNPGKCYMMTITHSKTPVIGDCYLNNEKLQIVSETPLLLRG